MDCIFCKLVKGEIPSTKVYEDDQDLAFLDINPANKGHTLVIPKRHYGDLEEIPADELASLMQVVQKVGKAMKSAVQADGFNIVQNNGRAAGQVVDHLHFHVIPRFASDGRFSFPRPQQYEEGEMQKVMDFVKCCLPHDSFNSTNSALYPHISPQLQILEG